MEWTNIKLCGCHGRVHIVVWFTTIYAIGDYHHQRCEFESRSDEVYSIQLYMIKFVKSMIFTVSYTNKRSCHDMAKILLKGALNTINPLSWSYDEVNASSIWNNNKLPIGNQTIVYINSLKKKYFYWFEWYIRPTNDFNFFLDLK